MHGFYVIQAAKLRKHIYSNRFCVNRCSRCKSILISPGRKTFGINFFISVIRKSNKGRMAVHLSIINWIKLFQAYLILKPVCIKHHCVNARLYKGQWKVKTIFKSNYTTISRIWLLFKHPCIVVLLSFSLNCCPLEVRESA